MTWPWCWGLGLSSVTGTRDGNSASTTRYVGFVCTAMDKYPCARGKAACSPALHNTWHASAQPPQAPSPCKRKAAAGCIAKLRVGCFLATHGISSYCFSSPRLLLQSPCQRQLHLPSSTPWLHRPCKGGRGCRGGSHLGAAGGVPLVFPPHFPGICRSSCYRSSRPGAWDHIWL